MVNTSDIEETANSGSTNNEESNRPACAACKHQRKKCRKGCLFLNHFPSNKQQEFSAVHQIFGIANATKMMKSIGSAKQSDTVASIIWEAMIWTNKDHREYGPLGVYKKLEGDVKELSEENKHLKEYFIQCQKLQEENIQLKENLVKCQQKLLFQCQCQSGLPAVHVSNNPFWTGEFSKTAISRNNNNNNAIEFEKFSQQRHQEHIQAMVPQSTMPPTGRSQLENITNRTGPINSSNSRLNRQRYEPYHHHNHHRSQQLIREGEFVGQHFAPSNQSQDNNFANRRVFGQQNHPRVSTPVQNNFTAEQQTQWKSS